MNLFKPQESALLLVDLQNDFLHPQGAYGRHGLGSREMAAVPERVAMLARALRGQGVTIISSQFTLVPTSTGPLMEEKFKKLRPFLGEGDFCPGEWGHSILDVLKPVDFVVEKVAYSAFYQSRLEFILKKLGIKELFIAGIVTNGGVASTVRDAHTRGYAVSIIEDGCGAFQLEHHGATIESLRYLVPVRQVSDFMN